MDPAMGIVGAILVARWSVGLLNSTSSVLLDRQGPTRIRNEIKECIESQDDNRVADLHLWSIGPNIVTHDPQATGYYKSLLPMGVGVVHANIEVYRCVVQGDIEAAPPADVYP